MPEYDVIVVGAGIVGLAHALAARRHGLSTLVIDRDDIAVGASIRNFGFITVTGQADGDTWRRAMRSRDVWAEIAPKAGIQVIHHGLTVVARRPEALTCLEEFAASKPMGVGCTVSQGTSDAKSKAVLNKDKGAIAGTMWSPHELRVESRTAIPKLAAYLKNVLGVHFATRTAVTAVASGKVTTTQGVFEAPNIVVCPGPDLSTLFPEVFKRRNVTLCKLHMFRVAPPSSGYTLPSAVMSDLGLVRYLGYQTPSLPALRKRLDQEQKPLLDDGIHLIVVQSADGSLVVGDSHHYGYTLDPFQPKAVDDRILEEFKLVLDFPNPVITERWTGYYPSGPDPMFMETVAPGVRLVSVTSGTGASTSFAIAEETLADLLGKPAPPHAHRNWTGGSVPSKL